PDRLFPDGGADVERLDVVIGEPVLFRAAERARPAAPGLGRKGDILAHRQVADDAVDLAVLRAETEFLADRRARRGQIEAPAASLRRTAVGALRPEQDLRRFRAARAQQAGDADHLAGPDVEVEG